jgi:probable phosphoglycerate mutase
MLLVYLARHGETAWNAAGRIQGHTDEPLNEAGRDQARELGRELASRGIAAVASSDLARARETAEIVARTLGLEPPVIEPALRERGLGVFEGLTREELAERWPTEWESYRRDGVDAPPEGEPYAAFFERITGGVRRLARRLSRPERPAVLVTHGGVMKALVLASAGTRALVTIPNGALFRFAVEEGRLRRVSSDDGS